MTSTSYNELDWRGLISDCTDAEALQERLMQAPVTLYGGFDPTADSLHVGHLLPLLVLRRFQKAGHHPIALAGGATGLIGDPSGKTSERQLLTREELAGNIASVKKQLERLLDFETSANPARLLDNSDWISPFSYLDFLRDVGKFFSIGMMLAKDSVRSRMEDRESGISYTEFSYMLLQAYDFYHLLREHDCELQVGGSDQWGNITAGIDLCRKKLGRATYGLTVPLLTNADGTKFGKTESGAVWLDPNKTSVYRFYQYWIRTDDRDVVRFLNYFTFLSSDEIAELQRRHEQSPERRDAHKALAKHLTEMVHGKSQTEEAIRASEILFGGDLEGVSEATFAEIVDEVPTSEIPKENLSGAGLSLTELLVQVQMGASKGQARRDIQGGGIYVNNIRHSDPNQSITTERLLFGKHLLLRKGKRNYMVVTAR